jgi:hypothetical protein
MVKKWESIGRYILLSIKYAAIFIVKIIDIKTELPYVHPVIRDRGAVEKRSSAVLRCKPHRSTYIYIRLAARFFARLASEHF